LLVWDISKSPAADHVLHPTDLPGQGRAAVVGYNQRHNLIVSADRDLLLWQPDPDAML
jgi:COMPASS component SWD2